VRTIHKLYPLCTHFLLADTPIITNDGFSVPPVFHRDHCHPSSSITTTTTNIGNRFSTLVQNST
jgi:hypothetical protein